MTRLEFPGLQASNLVIHYNRQDSVIVDNMGATYTYAQAIHKIESTPGHVAVNMAFRTLMTFDGDVTAMEAHQGAQ